MKHQYRRFDMKKAFFSVLTILSLLFSLSCYAFAAINVDGWIKRDEYSDANVEVLCNNSESGCGLHVLVSYYKPLQDSNSVYLSFGAELDGEQIESDGPFGIEVFIDDTPVIKFHADGSNEFDSEFYSVTSKSRIDFSSMKCESVIAFKYPLPENPKIYVRVTDNSGVASRLFVINTVMPQETTVTTAKTAAEASAEKEPEKTTRKTSKSSVSAANSGGNARRVQTEKSTDSSTDSQEYNKVSELTLPRSTDSSDSAASKKSVLMLISGIAVGAAIVGAVMTGIRKSDKKKQ